MPATITEKQLLRRKTSDTSATLTDPDIDLLFDEAEVDYSGYSRDVIFWAVVLARREELWMASAREVTYQQNETRENLSDIAKHLKELADAARKKLEELVALEKPVALRTAVMKKIPTRIKGYPNG